MNGSTAIAVVLVDFDDTLVRTAPRFQQARRDLFALLERHGFPEGVAYALHHEEIDPVMRERFGLGPVRLEHSFPATYRLLCARAGRTPEPAVLEACTALGRGVAGTPPPIDGALDALRELAAALPTVLYTQAGDAGYQLACVQGAGVHRILPPDRIRICESKTTDAFRATLAGLGVEDPATAWMIGNSVRSDINPALAAGAHAILVETEDPWEYDDVEPVHDAFVRVASFPAAVRYLLGRANGGSA